MTERPVDWSRCSLVESIPGKLSGAPVLKDTRMPVQGIVDNYDAGLTPEEVSEVFDLPLAKIIAVLEFRERQCERSPRS